MVQSPSWEANLYSASQKFPVFYGNRKLITAFTSTYLLSLLWASSIQSITPHPTSWRSILTLTLLTWRIWWASNNASKWQVGFNSVFKELILSSHLGLGLPIGPLPPGFSFLTTDYFLQQIYTSFFMTWLPSKPTTRQLRALGPVSIGSTLSRLQQWGGSCLTYCRTTGDSDGSSHLLSIRLADEKNNSLTSSRHSLPQ